MKIFKSWVYSNIHIALIAGALSLETNILLDVRPLGIAPLFIFFATLVIYNLGYFNALFSKEKSYREQARWMKVNLTYWVFSILIGLLALIYLIAKFGFLGQLTIGIFGLITFIYILHDVNLFGKYFSIRSIPYIKVFIVALTWSVITILPQIIDQAINLSEFKWRWLLFERFFFILSITLMFDVRDVHHDSKKLYTFPQILGLKYSKWLSVFFLGIASIGLFNLELTPKQLLGVLLIYFLTLFMVYWSEPDKDEVYYTGWFDGVIGLHAVVIIGLSFWP